MTQYQLRCSEEEREKIKHLLSKLKENNAGRTKSNAELIIQALEKELKGE